MMEAHMSDNDRRVFPMESALGVVTGKGGGEVLDFLGYAVQRDICDCARAAVSPAVKGWLYSLNPEFFKLSLDDGMDYASWVAQQKQKLGDNVSVTPMPAHEAEGINALLDFIEHTMSENEEKQAAADAAQAELKALAPFKAKAEDLEKKLAQLEEKNKALTEEASKLKAELAGYAGKVAINEKELEQSVKDLVSRAVKDALAALPVGAAAGAGAGAAAPGGAAAAPAAVDDGATAAPPDDFGFGASGPSDDGFGF